MFGVLIARRAFLKLALAGLVAPAWGYDGEVAPEHWAELSADYHTCGDGQRQSPIDIDLSKAVADSLGFDYGPIPIDLVNNGRTIQQAGSEGCTLTLDNRVYELVQFHFHTPSEHTHNGVHYPMEVHLVHRHRATGALAVVGIWIRLGDEQGDLALLGENLPQGTGERIKGSGLVNPANLLPQDRRFVRYEGSLTTPPCSEGVTWLVMTTPVEVSSRQIETFVERLGNNARPLQR